MAEGMVRCSRSTSAEAMVDLPLPGGPARPTRSCLGWWVEARVVIWSVRRVRISSILIHLLVGWHGCNGVVVIVARCEKLSSRRTLMADLMLRLFPTDRAEPSSDHPWPGWARREAGPRFLYEVQHSVAAGLK